MIRENVNKLTINYLLCLCYHSFSNQKKRNEISCPQAGVGYESDGGLGWVIFNGVGKNFKENERDF